MATTLSPNSLVNRDSYHESLKRWTTPHAASGYPTDYGQSLRDRREERIVRQFIGSLRPRSRVLDLPCGTGRLTKMLFAAGHQVIGADCSPWMVEEARKSVAQNPGSAVDRGVAPPQLQVCEARATGFSEKFFDAVICNRLLHHFRESETRIAVLSELGRICSGPILVSFFCSFAIDAVRFHLRHWRRGSTPTDRIPISQSAFDADARAAGLSVVATRSVLWGLSPQRYVLLHRAD